MTPSPKQTVLLFFQGAMLIAAGFWIFSPALHGGWLWDDGMDIAQNADLRSLSGLWKIWFDPIGLSNYFPLKFSVQWLLWQIWGDNTLVYHLASIGLHVLSAFLLWHLLQKLGLRLAWFGALLFVVHPLMVESVAWMVELKNTLSLPFFLLTMIFYIDWDADRKRRDYFLALAFFLAAMLSKSSVVMFPLVLLLYAWWKRGRIGADDLKACAGFLLITLILGAITTWFQQHHTNNDVVIPREGLVSWIASMGWLVLFYLGNFFFPTHLDPVYPSVVIASPGPVDFLPWLALALIAGGSWRLRRSWGRHVLLGFGFFLINLIPIFGFILMNYATMSWSMDHLVYVPMIGLIALVIAATGLMEQRLSLPLRPVFLTALFGIAFLLARQSHHEAKHFRNAIAYWTHALQRNPGAIIAHNNLGAAYLEANRIPEAADQFRQAILSKPDNADAYNGLAEILLGEGKTDDAVALFQQAAILHPHDAAPLAGISRAQLLAGHVPEAIIEAKKAVSLRPDYAPGYNSLGLALLRAGKTDEAVIQFHEALQRDADFSLAHADLGDALAQMGQTDVAVSEYTEAIRLDPGVAEFQARLGSAFLKLGRSQEAIGPCEEALKLKPNFEEAHAALGAALLQTNQAAAAVVQLREALRLKPGDSETMSNLALACLQSGNLKDAVTYYRETLQTNPDPTKAHKNLGYALLQSGLVTEAVAQYEEGLHGETDQSAAHVKIGTLLLQTSHAPEAMEQFQTAMQLNPDNADAHNGLGVACGMLGDRARAIAEFQKALKLVPGNAAIQQNLDHARMTPAAANPPTSK